MGHLSLFKNQRKVQNSEGDRQAHDTVLYPQRLIKTEKPGNVRLLISNYSSLNSYHEDKTEHNTIHLGPFLMWGGSTEKFSLFLWTNKKHI